MLTANCYNTLQTLFSERQPYVVQQRLGEPITIFTDVFIRVLRESFTTGCMVKMSEEEVALVNDLIEYQNTGVNTLEATINLDEWLVKLVNCEELPNTNDCSLTSEHTFNPCGL